MASKLVNQRFKKEELLNPGITVRDQIDLPKRTDEVKIKNYAATENKQMLYGQQKGNCNGCQMHFPYLQLHDRPHSGRRAHGGTASPVITCNCSALSLQ